MRREKASGRWFDGCFKCGESVVLLEECGDVKGIGFVAQQVFVGACEYLRVL